jgi:hypothetical protein
MRCRQAGRQADGQVTRPLASHVIERRRGPAAQVEEIADAGRRAAVGQNQAIPASHLRGSRVPRFGVQGIRV